MEAKERNHNRGDHRGERYTNKSTLNYRYNTGERRVYQRDRWKIQNIRVAHERNYWQDEYGMDDLKEKFHEHLAELRYLKANLQQYKSLTVTAFTQANQNMQ